MFPADLLNNSTERCWARKTWFHWICIWSLEGDPIHSMMKIRKFVKVLQGRRLNSIY
jgi:hypothetical protein